jgi:exosome complex component RRP42
MNENYIAALISKEQRLDGRALTEYRKDISIEYNISKNAEGSARVKFGDTEVIVGVKCEVGKPYPDNPNEGTIIVTTELLPLSSPEFEPGPPSVKATELARIVDRGIRESKCINFQKLCIKEGEKVWVLLIDIYTINDGGNLIDASALGTLAALRNFKFPEYDEENSKINYEEHTNKGLPLEKTPITVTISKINGKLIVDTTDKEEKAVETRLSIAISEDNVINAMQKGLEEPLTHAEIMQMIEIAIEKRKELIKHLK